MNLCDSPYKEWRRANSLSLAMASVSGNTTLSNSKNPFPSPSVPVSFEFNEFLVAFGEAFRIKEALGKPKPSPNFFANEGSQVLKRNHQHDANTDSEKDCGARALKRKLVNARSVPSLSSNTSN
ncbi:hypothetical protein SUGI_0593500 [Cryptomeria japonica]|nr:hypothetical protein SUGI_0593500 [Cryptomeria japonica]